MKFQGTSILTLIPIIIAVAIGVTKVTADADAKAIMADSHNCSAAVGSLVGIISGYSMGHITDIKGCASWYRNIVLLVVSVAAWMGLNAYQESAMFKSAGHNTLLGLNALVASLPSVAFILWDDTVCGNEDDEVDAKNKWMTRLIMVTVPILLTFIVANDTAQHKVCEFSKAHYVEPVKLKADDYLQKMKNFRPQTASRPAPVSIPVPTTTGPTDALA